MFDNVIGLVPAELTAADWAASCEAVVGGLGTLLLAAGHAPTALGVCELLTAAPATPKGLAALTAAPDGSLLSRALTATRYGCGTDGRRQEVIADGLRRLVYQPLDRRALLEASIRGVFLGHALAR